MSSSLTRILVLLIANVLISLSVIFVFKSEVNNSLTDTKGQAGLHLWRKHNCSSCHSIMGLGGHLGPDLTNVISRKGDSYVRFLIQYGNNKMPSFKLDSTEISALISYLSEIDKSLVYPIKEQKGHYFGKLAHD